jgi:hypothetical protein
MTKAKRKIVGETLQMNLFDLLVASREEQAAKAPGRLNIAARLAMAARCAIRNAPKSRETLADEMSELTGEHITVAMINNWTAESHPHRMPGELIPAFCISTGDNGMIEIQAEAAGVFTLPGPDALRAEIQRIDEQAKELHREKHKRMLLLKEIVG